jgi:hypothetical protein
VIAYRDAYNTGELLDKGMTFAPLYMGLLQGYETVPLPPKAYNIRRWTNDYFDSFPASGCVHDTAINDFLVIRKTPALTERSSIVHYSPPVDFNRRLVIYGNVDDAMQLWPEFGYDFNWGRTPTIYQTRAVIMSSPHEKNPDLETLLTMSDHLAPEELVVVPIESDVVTDIVKHYHAIIQDGEVIAAYGGEAVVTEQPILLAKIFEMQRNVRYVDIKRAVLLRLKALRAFVSV